jgi:hypothetical protein
MKEENIITFGGDKDGRMSIGELLAVLLFLVPIIGAAVVLIARRRSATVGTVAVVSLVLTVSSLGLLAFMASESFEVLTIEAQALYPMAPALIVLDLALTALTSSSDGGSGAG